MKENKKLVNFKEKTYTVYDPGQLKYYEYEKSRKDVVYSGVGLIDQLNPELPKIPYNGYRSYLKDNYGLTDLEYYIVVVLGGDESLLPECTYKNPYTGEKCTEKRKFRSLIPMYIRDANIIIVVYDITMKSSSINSNFWINETNDLKQENSMFVLVGNKLDLESERQVNAKEAEAFAKEKKFLSLK